jgi:hypothetical protein
MVTGGSYVLDLKNMYACSEGSAPGVTSTSCSAFNGGIPVTTGAGQFGETGDPVTFNILTPAGDFVQENDAARSLYRLTKGGMWLSFFFWLWRRISASFGDKSAAEES